MDSAKRGQFIAAAMQELAPRGFNLVGPTVQADVETSRFRRIVGWNNYWGIKSSKSWTGKEVQLLTTEFYRDPEAFARLVNNEAQRIERCTWDSGRKRWTVKIYADFRDWLRDREAMKWYAGLLQRGYPIAWANRSNKNPIPFFKGLMKGKWGPWATNEEYDDILIDRWERHYKGRDL